MHTYISHETNPFDQAEPICSSDSDSSQDVSPLLTSEASPPAARVSAKSTARSAAAQPVLAVDTDIIAGRQLRY